MHSRTHALTAPIVAELHLVLRHRSMHLFMAHGSCLASVCVGAHVCTVEVSSRARVTWQKEEQNNSNQIAAVAVAATACARVHMHAYV